MMERRRNGPAWRSRAQALAIAGVLALSAGAARAADGDPVPPSDPGANVVVAPDDASLVRAPAPPPASQPASTSAVTPVVTTASASPPAPPPAPRLLKRERHGPAVSVGFGVTYAALGGQLRYDIPLARLWTVSPFVAWGIATSVGVTGMLGARHRLAVDLAVGPAGQERFALHGAPVADRLVYGPAAGVAYEYMADGGFFVRIGIQYGYVLWRATVLEGQTGSLGVFALGWKVW